MGVITVRRTDNAEQVELTTTTTGSTFGDDRTVVAMRVNGETRDLQRELADGDDVELVLIGEPRVSRSCATCRPRHRAGAANLFAEAKLGIGPPIVDGFYYDFQTAPLTPEDLKAIEKRMCADRHERQRFVRRAVTDEEARAELADERSS